MCSPPIFARLLPANLVAQPAGLICLGPSSLVERPTLLPACAACAPSRYWLRPPGPALPSAAPWSPAQPGGLHHEPLDSEHVLSEIDTLCSSSLSLYCMSSRKYIITMGWTVNSVFCINNLLYISADKKNCNKDILQVPTIVILFSCSTAGNTTHLRCIQYVSQITDNVIVAIGTSSFVTHTFGNLGFFATTLKSTSRKDCIRF